MRHWTQRKARDLRHALQELRAGDSISRLRNGVRTTIVGGRPPGDDAVVPVPMGIERVLRKAAADQRFRARLMSDRAAAIGRSGLELSNSERAILLAIPAAHLEAMIAELAPSSPARRGLFRRLAAAAGIALFGVASLSDSGCAWRGRTAGESMDMPRTKGISPDMPRSQGIRPDRPPSEPASRTRGTPPGDRPA